MTETLQDKIDTMLLVEAQVFGEPQAFERLKQVNKAIQELREEILKLELLYVNSADAFTIRRRGVLALIGEKK